MPKNHQTIYKTAQNIDMWDEQRLILLPALNDSNRSYSAGNNEVWYRNFDNGGEKPKKI